MYPAQPGSPVTTLATGIDADDTTATATSVSGFAAATNLACLFDDAGNYEVVKYTGISGSDLTIERAFEGTAQAWAAGTFIANLIPAYAINSLQNNVNILAEQFGIQSIIGVEWDSSGTSPSLKRIDVDGNEIPKTSFNRSSFFDNYAIHGSMKRCSLTAAGVATFGSDAKGSGLTLTSDYIMVRIPRVYVKFEYESPYWRWWISPNPATGFTLHPAFYQRGHSSDPADQIYVGAYNAGASGGTTAVNGTSNCLYATDWTDLKLTSKSGVKPLTGNGSSGTLAQFETAANLIGTGWGEMNFHTLCLLQLLFYVEYASFDSQSNLGQGRTNASNTAASLCGTYLDQVGAGAGSDIQSLLATNGTYGDPSGSYRPAVWRGIENMWGNIWQFIIGYNSTDTEHRIINRDGSGTLADILTAGNYEAITSPIPLNGTTNISGTDAGAYCHGYVSSLALDASKILGPMFVPSALTGASNTKLTDYHYSHQSGISQTSVLLVGGSWAHAASAGVGYRASAYGPSYVNAAIGGRVEFVG
jgi:hypothetical protein